jgi:hypothetical protein
MEGGMLKDSKTREKEQLVSDKKLMEKDERRARKFHAEKGEGGQ